MYQSDRFLSIYWIAGGLVRCSSADFAFAHDLAATNDDEAKARSVECLFDGFIGVYCQYHPNGDFFREKSLCRHNMDFGHSSIMDSGRKRGRLDRGLSSTVEAAVHQYLAVKCEIEIEDALHQREKAIKRIV